MNNIRENPDTFAESVVATLLAATLFTVVVVSTSYLGPSHRVWGSPTGAEIAAAVSESAALFTLFMAVLLVAGTRFSIPFAPSRPPPWQAIAVLALAVLPTGLRSITLYTDSAFTIAVFRTVANFMSLLIISLIVIYAHFRSSIPDDPAEKR